MKEDEQISAAVLASTEDDMERAIMMSLAGATGTGSDDDAAAAAAGGGGGAAQAATAMAVDDDDDASFEFEPMPAVRRVGAGSSAAAAASGGVAAAAAAAGPVGAVADADEADDIAQAIAMSMGRPIDRGRRPTGAAPIVAPETPPAVRAERLMRAEQDHQYQAGLMEDEAR